MRQTIYIPDDWYFGVVEPSVDTACPALPKELQAITLPHVWNKDAPQQEGCRIYCRTIHAEPAPDQNTFIEFGAVAGVCRVWLNDIYLGEHRGGYSRFRFALTGALQPGDNRLIVTADNTHYQDIAPLGGDFNNYGGIYRHVCLITTGRDHFDLLYYGTNGLQLTTHPDGRVEVTARIKGRGLVEYTLTDENGIAAQAAATAGLPDAVLQVNAPHLWNGRQDPHLYTCRARLMVDGVCADEVSLPCGFRATTMTADKGFFLNGEHLKICGVSKHQDREGMGNAPTHEQLDEDLSLILELGANAVRLAHYQHPQYFYDLCDRSGLLVWAEIPMLGMPDGNDAIIENAKQQLTELICQNRHHPSIFCWGIQNEIAMLGESLEMYRKTRELNDFVKRLDDTRLTTEANLYTVKNNSPLNFIPDMVGYNVYFGWYHHEMQDYDAFLDSFHADNPQIPLGISEYGVDANPALHSATPKRKDYSEDFQALFHETVYPKIAGRDFVWGSFVWNMFDFGSAAREEGGIKGRNCKGLVTFDRKIKKDAFYYYKACWSQDPFVKIGGERFQKRSGGTTTVKVYSNQSKVSLSVNGVGHGTKTDGPVFTFENVPLQRGDNVVYAVSGACADKIVLIGVAEPEQSYIYNDPNPGYNVKNWFTLGQSEDDLFPTDRYSIMDETGVLFTEPRTLALLEQEIPEMVSNKIVRSMPKITLLSALSYRSGEYPEAFVKELNRKLKQIKKEQPDRL